MFGCRAISELGGNEKPDRLAKEGSEFRMVGLEPCCGVPISEVWLKIWFIWLSPQGEVKLKD